MRTHVEEVNRKATAVSLLLVCLSGLALAACTGSRPTDALSSVGNSVQPLASPASAALATNDVDPASAIARVRIAPVVGAPADASRVLAGLVSTQSTLRRIALVPAQSSMATHDMKGYFSAITEGGTTTVIYVWDVFDPEGNRLHRIQGQVAAPGTSPDGWSSVSPATMETIAIRTIDEFAAWLGQG